MKNTLFISTLLSGMVLLSGCSSVMSHTGGKEGLYPGMKASSTMLSDDDTNIGMKSWWFWICLLPRSWTRYCCRGICSAPTAPLNLALRKAKRPPWRRTTRFHPPPWLSSNYIPVSVIQIWRKPAISSIRAIDRPSGENTTASADGGLP